jgi:hypothetical protein
MTNESKETGGPAFPGKQKALVIQAEHREIASQYEIEHNGMTLRDYFAAKAMQAMLTSPEFLVVVTADEAVGGNAKERVSNVAFAYADAMLEARKK